MMKALLIAATLLLPACSASGSAPHGGNGTGSGGAAVDSGAGNAGSGGAATGAGKVGDACKTDSDCSDPPGAKCFTTVGNAQVGTVTFPKGYCSKDCSVGSVGSDGGNSCGTSGGCTDFGSSSGGGSITLTMCTAPCKKDSDCRTADGYHCQILAFGFGYCAP